MPRIKQVTLTLENGNTYTLLGPQVTYFEIEVEQQAEDVAPTTSTYKNCVEMDEIVYFTLKGVLAGWHDDQGLSLPLYQPTLAPGTQALPPPEPKSRK